MSIEPGKTTVIHVSQEQIAERQELYRLSRSGEKPPRWPVSVRCSDLHYAEIQGVGQAEYLNDPVTHAEAQIAGQKWMLENLQTDANSVIVCPLLAAGPSAFGAEIVASPAGRAWIKPWIRTGDDLRKLEHIDPNQTGTTLIYNQWSELYEDIAEQYPVRFSDGEVFFPLAGQTRPLTTGTTGPFSLAADLMGTRELMDRIKTDLYFVEDLLEVLTYKIVDTLTQNRQAEDYDGVLFVSCSSARLLDSEQYESLALPCLMKIKEQFQQPIALHQSTLPPEQLELIINKLKPRSISGFRCKDNCLDSLAVIAQTAGGKCYLEPHFAGKSLADRNAEDLFTDAFQTLLLFDRFGKFHLTASAPDALSLEQLPKLNAIHRASLSLQQNAT